MEGSGKEHKKKAVLTRTQKWFLVLVLEAFLVQLESGVDGLISCARESILGFEFPNKPSLQKKLESI